MFGTLDSLGINGLKIGSDSSYSTRNERRDIWLQSNGRSLKMGSKGIIMKEGVAYHGFKFFIDKQSTSLFKYIMPCGYAPDEVTVTSIEEVLNKRIKHQTVHEKVKDQLKKHFRYSCIFDLPYNGLVRELNKHE